jgi:hypothetical protein
MAPAIPGGGRPGGTAFPGSSTTGTKINISPEVIVGHTNVCSTN